MTNVLGYIQTAATNFTTKRQVPKNAKLRALSALTPTPLTHHSYEPYAPAHLRTFTLINRHLMRLCLVLLQIPLSVSSHVKKFNIVRNDHGHTQRCEILNLTGNTLFRQIWPKKVKVVSLSWNLIPRPIRICRIQWWCSLFLLSTVNLVQKINTVSLGWNLVPMLIRIWIIWW